MPSLDCITPSIIPNPVGIDVVINNIQSKLSEIDWLEKSFGKSYIVKEEQDGRVLTMPKCWIGHNEYVTMYPNDNVDAFSFIESFESETVTNYESYKFDHQSEFDISIVVFANLDRIDNTQDYIFTERLINDVYDKLNKIPETKEINTIKRGIDAAYKNWSIESVEPVYYSPKYSAFNIELSVILSSSCYSPNDFNITNC